MVTIATSIKKYFKFLVACTHASITKTCLVAFVVTTCNFTVLKFSYLKYFALFTALEKLREEFKADSESLAHSEAISILSLDD